MNPVPEANAKNNFHREILRPLISCVLLIRYFEAVFLPTTIYLQSKLPFYKDSEIIRVWLQIYQYLQGDTI